MTAHRNFQTCCWSPHKAVHAAPATRTAAETELREMIARYDVNGDGIIDYAEFLKVGAHLQLRHFQLCMNCLE